MQKLISIKTYTNKNINLIAAYTATLYFFEIIFLMFTIALFYKKHIAILIALAFAILLSTHIIRLFLKRSSSRKMHLFFIDIHAAYTIHNIIYRGILGPELNIISTIILSIKTIIVLLDLVLIYFLTENDAIECFNT